MNRTAVRGTRGTLHFSFMKHHFSEILSNARSNGMLLQRETTFNDSNVK